MAPGARRDHRRVFVAALVVGPLRGEKREGHPGLHARVGEGEALGHDADHRVGFGVQPDGPADQAGVRAEAVPPQGMAEHDDVVGARLGVGVGEHAAAGGAGLEGGEERGRHALAGDALGFAGVGEVVAPVGEHGRIGEAADAGLAVEKIRDGDAGVGQAQQRVGVVNIDEALGAGPGVGLEEDGVDDGEDGGVGADAQGQRGHGHGGEAGGLEERAEGEAEVRKHGKNDG